MALPGYGTVTHPLIQKEFGVPVLSQVLLEVLQKQNKTEGKPHPHGTSLPTRGGKQRAQAQTRGLIIRCASRSRHHLADVQERPPCADYRRQAPLWATRGGDYVNTRIASSEQEGHSIRLPISPKCHSFETGSIPRTVI